MYVTDHNDAADDEEAHFGERDTRLPPVRGLNRRPRNAPLSATASHGRALRAPTDLLWGNCSPFRGTPAKLLGGSHTPCDTSYRLWVGGEMIHFWQADQVSKNCVRADGNPPASVSCCLCKSTIYPRHF